MPIGKLVLKGGEPVGGVNKKKKAKKHKQPAQPGEAEAAALQQDAQAAPAPAEGGAKDAQQQEADGQSENKSGSAHPARVDPKLEYEKEFQYEAERMSTAKPRSNAWGVTYREPPSILHGYDRKVTGDTYEERLDLRCAKKADRMCK